MHVKAGRTQLSNFATWAVNLQCQELYLLQYEHHSIIISAVPAHVVNKR